MKANVKLYQDDFKLLVVQEYLTTTMSQQELMEKYGIGGNNTITRWIRKFGLVKPDDRDLQTQRAMEKETGKSSRELELESRIQKLEKELEHEQLRIRALNTMIDIAERELEISIRKKRGAKQ